MDSSYQDEMNVLGDSMIGEYDSMNVRSMNVRSMNVRSKYPPELEKMYRRNRFWSYVTCTAGYAIGWWLGGKIRVKRRDRKG
jgi:hypothetical protein